MNEPTLHTATVTPPAVGLPEAGSAFPHRLRRVWKRFIQVFATDINAGYEEAFRYAKLDRFSIRLLWWNFGAFVFLTSVNSFIGLANYIESPFSWRVISSKEALTTVLIGAVAAGLPMILRDRIKTHYHYRLLVSVCLITFSYLFVFITGGSIEAHFHFFIVITYLAAYADWRLGWVALVLTLLHHTILDFVAPHWVFFYGHNLLSPAAHGIPVLVAAILAGVLSENHRTALLAQKELEKRREEFISMASHELKTPVTSISIFNEVLERSLHQHGIREFDGPFTMIREQLKKLTKLISDLLDITRTDTLKLSYTFSVFDFGALVREVVMSLQGLSNSRAIIVRDGTELSLCADRDRIAQVLINLLTNALKYSPAGADVQVTVTQGGGSVTVCVEDQGIGIAPEHHDKIFERFYRVYEQDERTYPGMGIGLYLSAEIVRRHGGAIWVESSRGSGSKFFFSLPVQVVQERGASSDRLAQV